MFSFSSTVRRSILPCALIVLSILFFVGGPGHYSTRHFKMLWNFGHIIFFALLPVYLFYSVRRMPQNFAGQLILVLGLALVLGGMIEIAQKGTHRLSEFGDLFRNFIGAMAALFFLLPGRKTVPLKILRGLQIFVLLSIATQVHLVWVAFADEYRAFKQYPVLSDFESDSEIQRWEGDADFSIEDEIAFNGRRSMRIALGTEKYSGVFLFYFPRNWEGYRVFQFSLYNPDPEEIAIILRINDKKHIEGPQQLKDRFNRRYSIAHGWHTISVGMEEIADAPEGRTMDMNHILGVGIFATQLPYPRVVYLDDVKLSNTGR